MYSRIRSLLCVLLAWGLTLPAAAQHAPDDEPAHNLGTFETLALPAPNQYRSASGKPGPAYWQQRADYRIRATLDPQRHRITGTETITYTNNAPEALEYLWIQLDQNLFAPGSRGSAIQPPDSRWRGSFEGGGYTLSRVELVRNGRRQKAQYLVEDTRLRIRLDEPMAPGGSQIQIEIDYGFTIPQYGADRMGRLDVAGGTVYTLAQWFPRMFVYDDVHGWNALPYLGQGEFYLNYGDYDVELTVPRDFIVVGTGRLLNPEEVLTEEQRRRLDRARRSTETVMIVGPDEVGQPATRPAGSGPLTWKFRAENVRDVAYGLSQAFVWDAAGWNDVLIMSAYPKEGLQPNPSNAGPGWEEATQFGLHAIRHYAERWYPYPYPVAVNVGGVVAGMEYPMVNFSSAFARGQSLFGVTDHELGHNWFPMIVGSDERRYAWMDEGFNTFINYYSNQDFYGPDNARGERVASDYIAGLMQSDIADQPAATYPDRIRRAGLGFLAYRKPGKGLLLLREYVLGPERFDSAFRAYIERWAFKHPQPADFFRTIEDVAGEDLDWFWRGWFYSTDVLDQAIEAVAREDGNVVITVANQEGLVMPAELQITYRDGRTERRRIPVEAWATSDTFQTVVRGGDVVGVTLDPDAMLPDVDRSDNTWSADGGALPQPPRGG